MRGRRAPNHEINRTRKSNLEKKCWKEGKKPQIYRKQKG
jgi:hypothetical protein